MGTMWEGKGPANGALCMGGGSVCGAEKQGMCMNTSQCDSSLCTNQKVKIKRAGA